MAATDFSNNLLQVVMGNLADFCEMRSNAERFETFQKAIGIQAW